MAVEIAAQAVGDQNSVGATGRAGAGEVDQVVGEPLQVRRVEDRLVAPGRVIQHRCRIGTGYQSTVAVTR